MSQTIAEPTGLVLTLAGRMDTPACLKAEPDILSRVKGTKGPVVFDMQAVSYVSSMFLRLCLRTAQEIGSQNLLLTGVCPEIKKVFKIAGFDQQIRIS